MRPARPAVGRGKLVENERIKLSAAYLNGVAVALMTAGVLAPVISSFGGGSAMGPLQLSGLIVICILLSVGLHLVARLVLGGLFE
ncbi:MAG: amino acid transporter [Devosia sp.]|nr:amino acid transporter [Devosia sp.]